MFGNYLGTIAMCGLVAEMVAILLFEIGEVRINNVAITDRDQIEIFGSTFEKLSQARRVSILHAYGMIDEQLKEAFELIRERRRRYLHFWSQNHDDLPADARAAFNAAVLVTVSAIGQSLQEGKLVLNPRLVKYLGACPGNRKREKVKKLFRHSWLLRPDRHVPRGFTTPEISVFGITRTGS
jgi:hypothetical protein